MTRKQELHRLGEGALESDVSFPRNPFIMITRSQEPGLLFQLQNLEYDMFFFLKFFIKV